MEKYLLTGERTARLYFRKITTGDFENWLPFHLDPRSSRYWQGLPTDPYEACRAQFDRIFERYEKGLGGMNGLILKNTNTLIGMCGLLVQEIDQAVELEIGYSILPEYWHLGYATEAAECCKKQAFHHEYAPSLISIIHVDNIPSQNVAYKNGMFLDKTCVYKGNPVHIFRIFGEAGLNNKRL